MPSTPRCWKLSDSVPSIAGIGLKTTDPMGAQAYQSPPGKYILKFQFFGAINNPSLRAFAHIQVPSRAVDPGFHIRAFGALLCALWLFQPNCISTQSQLNLAQVPRGPKCS